MANYSKNGNIFRYYRQLRGKTIIQLRDEVTISKMTLVQIESNPTYLPKVELRRLQRIVKALNIPPEELVTELFGETSYDYKGISQNYNGKGERKLQSKTNEPVIKKKTNIILDNTISIV